MNVKVMRLTKVKTIWWTLVLLGAGTVLLMWPEAAATGARRGLGIASQVLIPAIFPFLVLGNWMTGSGLCDKLGEILGKPLRWVGLPGVAASVWLIGLVGGYPAGAAAVGKLCQMERLTPSQARRLLAGCVNAGPGFCVATVGVGMLKSAKIGGILWAAHAVASTLILLFYRPKETEAMPPTVSPPLRPSAAMVEAVGSASKALLGMTGFVALACLLLSVMSAAGVPPAVRTLVACVTEVTSGSMEVLSSPFLLGWTLGWGGLSVHGQIATLLPSGVLSKGFFVARFVHGYLAGLLTLWWMPPSALSTFVALSGLTAEPFASASALGGVSMLVLCVTWLVSMRKKVDF
ncbi:MAG: hypothetical protein IJC17_06530 [Clostridia bacterium]|nr:hypothetical protein [Clostridia bacterium]